MKTMTHSKLFLFLILSLIAVSCSQAPEETTAKVSVGYLTGSTNYQAGLYIIAEQTDGKGYAVRMLDNSDAVEMVLPNGSWNFTAIGWNGTEHFEGDVFCARQNNVKLGGGDFNLAMSATEAGCANLGQPVDADNDFYTLDFTSCIDVKPYVEEGYPIEPGIVCGTPGVPLVGGLTKGIKISFPQVLASGEIVPGLTSGCYSVSSHLASTSVKLPYGNSVNRLNYIVEMYDSTTCNSGTPPLKVSFSQGLAKPANGFLGLGLRDDSTESIKVILNELACVGDQLTNRPFAAGSTSSGSYLVCNEAQWNNIATPGPCTAVNTTGMGCEADKAYILGANIDFGGSNTSIVPNFSGEFRGAFKTLSNFNNPLFSKITTLFNDVRISDLNIDSANIAYAGDNKALGLLASVAENSGNGAYQVEIDNINITNSSVADTSGGSNGHPVGGLIGLVDWRFSTPVIGEDFSLRKITSTANISTNNVGQQAIGGLIGKIRGNDISNVNLELNNVGVKERSKSSWASLGRFNYDDYSEQISLNAGNDPDISVGGLVGEIYGFAGQGMVDIRVGNVAYSTVQGVSSVGGLIGSVDQTTNYTKIDNSYARLVFVPQASSTYIGGVIGKVYNAAAATSIDIEGTAGHLIVGTETTPETSFGIVSMGGIIGFYQFDNPSPALSIKDSRGVMETYVEGQEHGGIAGSITCTGTCSSGLVVERSIAMGTIGDESSSGIANGAGNDMRGGLVGLAEYIETNQNIVHMNIEGENYIGAAYGQAQESYTSHFDSNASLRAYTAFVGGIAGSFVSDFSEVTYVNSVKLNNEIYIQTAVTNCALSFCGELFGTHDFSNTGTSHSIDVLSISSINDINNSDFTGSRCGNVESECSNSVGDIDNFTVSDTNCGALTGNYSIANIDGAGNKCELDFIVSLAKFAPVIDANGDLEYYRMGSIIDPYEIKTVADWNKIGSDPFLMKKSFEVVNDIDFGGTAPTRIGTTANISGADVFSGKIFGDGVIKNASLTVSGTYSGLINTVNGGSIGLRNLPLQFDSLLIICNSDSINSCGLIGFASNAEIAIVSKNARVVETGATLNYTVGGILGTAGSNNEMNYSEFQGFINTPLAYRVGGLVGSTESASGDVRISDSSAKLNYIISHGGSGKVGGLIGDVSIGSNSSSIKDSYVWLDPSEVHSGGDIVGSWRGLLVGLISESNFKVENCYVDISTGTIPASTEILAHDDDANIEGGSITNYGVIGPGLGNAAVETAPWLSDHQTAVDDYADLVSTLTTFGDDKWLINNGRLVREWEVYGFDF